MMSRNKLLYGFDDPLPVQQPLKAGPFSMVYENGALRYIRYGDNEIIRMIYIALRDKNWGTYFAVIENENINRTDASFDIRYTSRITENDQTLFTWDVHISGDENGKINFSANGRAIKDLMKNRAGFCILHPIKNTAGELLVLTQYDGREIPTNFPSCIAPFMPLSDITKLQWRNNGNDYILELKGETFEMEDQRNWTDASFKTFCTPLSLPFPVQLKKDETVCQEIVFYPLHPPATLSDPADDVIRISIDPSQKSDLPLIGVGASTEIDLLNQTVIKTLKETNFQYYTVAIKPSNKEWKETLLKEINTAEDLQTDLFISLEVSDNYQQEFNDFAAIVAAKTQRLKYLLLNSADHPVTTQPVIEWAEKTIPRKLPDSRYGIGASANFTELNRNRKNITTNVFVSYAIHPQEHAFDHLSLIENTAAQYDTVQSAKAIYPDAAIFVTPVTLRRRVNPYAHDPAAMLQTNEQKKDPRQMSLWNAGWTLASMKYLAEAGVSGITYFQTVGKQGCCDATGELYPVGCLLQFICLLKNSKVVVTTTHDPLACTSLLLEKGNKQCLLLANHTPRKIKVVVPAVFAVMQTVSLFPSVLESGAGDVNGSMVELKPFDVAILSEAIRQPW